MEAVRRNGRDRRWVAVRAGFPTENSIHTCDGAVALASDQHPDHHVLEGERFIASVYTAAIGARAESTDVRYRVDALHTSKGRPELRLQLERPLLAPLLPLRFV